MSEQPLSASELLAMSAPEIFERYPEACCKEEARGAANKRHLLSDRPLVYGEGDSWFDFPWWVIFDRHSDILDVLLFKHELCVQRDSKAGDTLWGMSKPDNLAFLSGRIRSLRPKAFLLSGGGNDLFAGGKDCASLFYRLLRQNDPNDPVVTEKLERALDRMMNHLTRIATVAIDLGVPVLIHGYGLPPQRVFGKAAVKFFAGPWIKPVLDSGGTTRSRTANRSCGSS